MRRAIKVYDWLLRLYPARFREEYGKPMQQQFRDEYREAESRGERARLWLLAAKDVVTSAPGEIRRELALDLKYATRVYRKRPVTTGLAVVALGLAVGASTGIFSVVNALLLRGLPFREPAQLVELWMAPVSAMQGRAGFRKAYQQSAYLQDAAAFSSSEMNLSVERGALRVKVAETSANFFQLLGVKSAAGRTFAGDEDIWGRNEVAVISSGLWRQEFGERTDFTGATVRVNGAIFSVIGVAPPGFDYPAKTAVWIPTVFDFEKTPKRGAFLFQTIGRLKPAIRMETARELFHAEIRQVYPGAPEAAKADNPNGPHLASLQNQLAGPVRQASWVLGGLTLLVLLTACANVALLLLSRTTERREELKLRAALGASRARLLQQLVTEATFLTAAGAALGLVVAEWISRIANSLAPPQLATQTYNVLDWRVLLFAAALAIGMGVFFGVLPVCLKGRLGPSSLVMRVQAATRDVAAKRATGGLIALQVALTLCVVTSAFVLGRTFLNLLRVDLGFRTENVVTLNVSVQGTRHQGPGEWAFYRELLERLRAVPGVQAAGAVSYLPLADNVYMANAFTMDSGEKVARVVMNATMPGYFQAMGTRFLKGRDFLDTETQQPEPSAIVNEAFAAQAGLGAGIVGHRLKAPWSSRLYLVVGVVRTESFSGPAYGGEPQIYWPVQEEPPQALTFVARVQGDADAYVARCRDALRSMDPQVPVYEAETLNERLTALLARPRLYSMATLFLAVLSLLLAVAGVYGSAANSIARRRHEMGVRMAMGATRRGMRGMMLRESLVWIVPGAAAGVVLAMGSGRYLKHLLEGAGQPTLWTSMGAGVVLVVTAVVAVWMATERVVSIDPADALRAE